MTHLYGLTEVYGPAVVNDWKDEWNALDDGAQAHLKARQGVRYHALEALDVMDPETMQPVPADGETMGEVMFRGNVVMKGYLKNKAATDKAFAGGWFHSGDLGVKHKDGYMQLQATGRRTSSFPAARTFPRSRSRTRCSSIPGSRPRWCRGRTTNGARRRAPSSR